MDFENITCNETGFLSFLEAFSCAPCVLLEFGGTEDLNDVYSYITQFRDDVELMLKFLDGIVYLQVSKYN